MARNSAEVLAQLRDIRLPEPPVEPAQWPLYIAIAAIFAGLLSLCLLYRHRRLGWAFQTRRTISELRQQEPSQAVHGMANLLKRTVLTLSPDAESHNLNGEQWLKRLDVEFRTDFFTRRQGRVFGSDMYRPKSLSQSDRDAIATQLDKLLRKRSWRWW